MATCCFLIVPVLDDAWICNMALLKWCWTVDDDMDDAWSFNMALLKWYLTIAVDLRCACGQGLIALHTNPILADSTAGLATTATAFAAIEVGESLIYVVDMSCASRHICGRHVLCFTSSLWWACLVCDIKSV